ncbi:hypothetical protein ACFPRL_26205 [Pseudoclavibacter helvolus]
MLSKSSSPACWCSRSSPSASSPWLYSRTSSRARTSQPLQDHSAAGSRGTPDGLRHPH